MTLQDFALTPDSEGKAVLCRIVWSLEILLFLLRGNISTGLLASVGDSAVLLVSMLCRSDAVVPSAC